MKKLIKHAILSCLLSASFVSCVNASNYPGFTDNYICHSDKGYEVETGYVSKVAATTLYANSGDVYMEIADLYGNPVNGGRIYVRYPSYYPLVRSAYIALLTKVPVRACIYNSVVYALELNN